MLHLPSPVGVDVDVRSASSVVPIRFRSGGARMPLGRSLGRLGAVRITPGRVAQIETTIAAER